MKVLGKILEYVLHAIWLFMIASMLCGTITLCLASYEARNVSASVQWVLAGLAIFVAACFLSALKQYLKQ